MNSTGPASTTATYGPNVRAERELNAERDEDVIGDIHAEHHEVALGEIDHAHDAEDEREADAHQAVDRADESPAASACRKFSTSCAEAIRRVGRAS